MVTTVRGMTKKSISFRGRHRARSDATACPVLIRRLFYDINFIKPKSHEDGADDTNEFQPVNNLLPERVSLWCVVYLQKRFRFHLLRHRLFQTVFFHFHTAISSERRPLPRLRAHASRGATARQKNGHLSVRSDGFKIREKQRCYRGGARMEVAERSARWCSRISGSAANGSKGGIESRTFRPGPQSILKKPPQK